MIIHPPKRWRFENGVTLARLAKAAGLSITHLSDVERGRRRLSGSAALKIAKAFGKLVPKPAGN